MFHLFVTSLTGNLFLNLFLKPNSIKIRLIVIYGFYNIFETIDKHKIHTINPKLKSTLQNLNFF